MAAAKKKTRKSSNKSNRGKKRKVSAKTPPAIPKGFGSVTPYLVIKGAAEALEFYKKAFGAKELSRQPTPDGKLLHASMKIGGSIVMLMDEFEGADPKAPISAGTTTVMMHIYTSNVDKFWERAVESGAKVLLPLDNQFWGERYGQLTDPFGHRWSVSMQVKMSKEEKEAKQQQAMSTYAQHEHPGKQTEEMEKPEFTSPNETPATAS